ncbi:MAG: hypothetical protein JW771_00970 [Candidatus Thermoplasmatota archaeon]|nr:hypothetical protein [Candidatus Thermoplasmatota archaeon]
MNYHTLHIMKTVMIAFLLFITVLSVTPASSALYGRIAKLYECEGAVRIEYDENTVEQVFLPVDMVMEIPLNISFSVQGYYAEELLEYYTEGPIFEASIEAKPEWCSVAILPSLFDIIPRTEWNTKECLLSIKVNENAQAYSEGTIRVKIQFKRFGSINNGTFYQDIPFKPGFLPLLKISTSETTVKQINPQETAMFTVQVQNLGNAKTELLCNVVDKPKDWTVAVEEKAVVGSKATGDDDLIQMSVVVKPPFNFGYHHDREVIQLSITPSYFGNDSLTGEEYLVSFIVQSRGFSTPGFEGAYFIIGFACVLFLFHYQQRKIMTCSKRQKEDEYEN